MERTDPLLETPIAGVVDYHGRTIASRSNTGRWNSAFFIIGMEIAERFAFMGIMFNLINYMTGPLGQSTAGAAAAVNAWSGVSWMMPLLGAFVADSWLGRYRTIVLATVLYILGFCMLTLSSLLPSTYCSSDAMATSSCRTSKLQIISFYVSLYLVAFAQGGHKPCTQAFGADQFDPNHPFESKSRSSFFNWWFFGMNLGMLFTNLLNYVQDNISWSFGFGIPGLAMVVGLLVFLAGTRTYRYCVVEEKNPFLRIGGAFVALIRKWRQDSAGETLAMHGGPQSLACEDFNPSSSMKEDIDDANIAHQIEEAKAIIRLFPIWSSCLIFGILTAQLTTLFVKQASTLDRRIAPSFQVPPASLQSISALTVLLFIPIYDHILVPLASKFSGISMLQRIGIGIVISLLAMVIAALVEMKRLETAEEHGLVELPNATVPMSLWWLVPQFMLFGIANVFTMIGLQEFFYDQVPDELRSLGTALCLSIYGVGFFVSGFLITVIDEISGNNGKSWFSSNLNDAHLDYFYWLLAGTSAVGLFIFVILARGYNYRRKG